jgi:hypothetical protein
VAPDPSLRSGVQALATLERADVAFNERGDKAS